MSDLWILWYVVRAVTVMSYRVNTARQSQPKTAKFSLHVGGGAVYGSDLKLNYFGRTVECWFRIQLVISVSRHGVNDISTLLEFYAT